LLDNTKGRLDSAALECFLSAATYGGRRLGANEDIAAPNLATVFVTGNGLTVSPDMRRRSLVVELRLEVERAEDRQFRRLLDDAVLLAMRPQILAALWALVRNWDTSGRPGPSRSHSAFPAWAQVVGGIVEAAGYACPLETPALAVDSDGEDMRELATALADRASPLAFSEVVGLARERELFADMLGGAEMDRRAKSAFSKLLGRYDHRLVGDYRFLVDGKGRERRYAVEPGHPCHGGHGRHGVSDEKGKYVDTGEGRKHHDTPCHHDTVPAPHADESRA
jgi:hypothetical protein